MAALLAQRCLHHPPREAVARCLECTQFFCRECITEHDDRVICSSCLRKLTARPDAQRRSFAPIARIAALLSGAIVAWVFFFVIGRLVVNVPTDFHEATLWREKFLEAAEE